LWWPPIVPTLFVATVLMVGGRPGDLWLNGGTSSGVLHDWMFVRDPERARDVILAALELPAGVFAISITVLAIIVQLSATRHTSRVVELFLADPFNILIVFACVVPLLHGFWTCVASCSAPAPASAGELKIGAFRSTISFYCVEQAHRESVNLFYAWLLGGRPLPREIAQSAWRGGDPSWSSEAAQPRPRLRLRSGQAPVALSRASLASRAPLPSPCPRGKAGAGRPQPLPSPAAEGSALPCRARIHRGRSPCVGSGWWDGRCW
jgi:hypothetical protein